MVNRRYFALFILLYSGTCFSQSPWIPSVNDGFIQASYSGLYYNSVSLNNEVVNQPRNTINNTYQLYLDFGLLPNIGVTAIVPVTQYSVTQNKSTGSYSGLGNLSFTVRYELPISKAKSVLGLTYSAKTANNDVNQGLRTGFDATTFMPFVSVGSGTKKTYFYANLGYGVRTNKHSNFVRLSGELGYKIIKNGYIIGTIDLTNPTNKSSEFFESDPDVYKLSASYLDRQSFNGAGIKILYEFVPERYGLTLSTIGALGSNNVPFSRSYNFGLYKKF